MSETVTTTPFVEATTPTQRRLEGDPTRDFSSVILGSTCHTARLLRRTRQETKRPPCRSPRGNLWYYVGTIEVTKEPHNKLPITRRN